MSGGMVTGGWNFVIAAYSITFVALAIYGVSLVMRFREEFRRAAEERDK